MAIEAHRREVRDAILGTTAALVAEHGLTAFFTRVLSFLKPIPEPILGLALLRATVRGAGESGNPPRRLGAAADGTGAW